MRSRTDLIFTFALIVILLGLAGGVTAQGGPPVSANVQTTLGTAFTYQGKITNNGGVVNGNCNMAFRLFDAASTGNSIGSAITTTVPVTNSRFTVALDFGTGIFAGQARWLELRADCGSGYVTLNPRQAIAAAPEALHAQTADSAIWKSGYYPLYRPQTLELTTVDPALEGFQGGFTDGRYGYFVPFAHGTIARVDLQNFTTSGVASLDLTQVDPSMKGYMGGFTDGRYGYFVPYYNGTASHGKIARVDLQNFITSSVTVLDLALVNAGMKGYMGGFTDGRYGYFAPRDISSSGAHGKLARVDLYNFTTGGVTLLDLTTVNSNLRGFTGGFTEGRYGYLVPSYTSQVTRVDLQNFTTGGVTTLNLAPIDTQLIAFSGGFTDGRYGYFVPFASSSATYLGKVARLDLLNFTLSGVTVLDLTTIDPDLKGFSGGFTDGRYGYFVPASNSISTTFGKVVRVDLHNFTTTGVTVLDMTATDPELTGFIGGFTDGQYGYFVPWSNGTSIAKVARIQLFSGGGSP